MVYQPYSHLGFVVTDLERAMMMFKEEIGVQWREPWEMHLPAQEGAGAVDSVAVYTLGRAPAIELVQSSAGTLFESDEEIALHHLGFWSDDFKSDVANLAERGCTLLRTHRNRKGDAAHFALHRSRLPFLIELSDPSSYEPGRPLGFLSDQVPSELRAAPREIEGMS